MASHDPKAVLEYWLGPPVPEGTMPTTTKSWFGGGPTVDAEIRERFAASVAAAGAGELDSWLESPRDTLALLILLDQFTRNVYRGTPQAFAFDARARKVAREALARGHDRAATPVERTFFYLPFEHSEDLADQTLCIEKTREALAEAPEGMKKFLEMAVDYAIRHRVIIERFGRFPHRNAILGRESTPEEVEFLKTPGSSF